MKLRLQHRRYRLAFQSPVRTAHGWWREREGVIIRTENEAGRVGFGEVAPIPWFGTETIEEAERALAGLGEWTTADAMAAVPARLGCLRNALASANAGGTALTANDRSHLGVAALLPAGRAALAAIPGRVENGFRVFKWKVGVGDLADELTLLDDVCAALPAAARLRLDANGAWDRRQAERWLERAAERPVEYVEQPCFAAATEGAARQAKMDELLLGLAGDYPTPIALDESLVGDGDIERWLRAGWTGVYVIKPALMGDLAGALTRLEKARASVVFSSALETAVGAQAALRAAFRWRDATEAAAADGTSRARALGFGVWPLFAESRFDGPFAAPFFRREDVEALNPEAVWSALN